MNYNINLNAGARAQGIAQNPGAQTRRGNVNNNSVSGQVLGEGEGRVNFEVKIPLIPLAFEVLTNQIDRTVVFDVLIASEGRVFVNGRLIKNIPFKTRDAAVIPRCSNISRLIIGDIRHITAVIPFSMVIDVNGSVRGANVVVVNSSVDSAEILNTVRTCKGQLVRSITEKDLVTACVRVISAEGTENC